MQIAYPHIAERLFGRALAIDPIALRPIMEGPLAKRILSGEDVSKKEAKKGRSHRLARLSAFAGEVQRVRAAEGLIDYAITPDGVAIMPIAGVLSRRFDWLAAACGFSTYESIEATLSAVMQDYRVNAVLLDVDTPGGEAAGMLDTADAILAARDKKPIWAVANTLAASAGYALAGSASKLFTPRLGQVGSIGCVMVHVDQSLRDQASGLNYTAIYSGARKIDGWGHAPLSDGAMKAAQADVDHCRDVFADLVGRQGRASAKAALATEAAVYSDDNAVKARLADGVMTFDEALSELTSQLKSQEGSMGNKAALNSSTSHGTILVADEAARRAVLAAQPVGDATAHAADAAPAADATASDAQPVIEAGKKKSDMTPPAPGEACDLCGQVMPGDDGEPTDPDAKAGEYTVEMAMEVMDLCTIAKVPGATAKAFVAAKTPIANVRAELAKLSADAANALAVDGTARPAAAADTAAVDQAWDAVVAEQNAKLPQNKKR